MPGTNTLAYYEHELITTVKSFVRLGPPGRGGFRSNAFLPPAGNKGRFRNTLTYKWAR